MFALSATKTNFSDLDTLSLGLAGEALIASILVRSGYHVEHVAPIWGKSGDLRVTCLETGVTFTIEVKTARQSQYDGRWQFCINKTNHTRLSNSDLCVLVAIDSHNQPFLYLFPSLCLDCTQFTLSSHPTRYRGKIAPFRQRGLSLDFKDMHDTMSVWSFAQ